MHTAKAIRYVIERETPPRRCPRWWRDRWGVVDTLTSNRAIVEWFWAYGAAEHRARCLNGQETIGCQSSGPAESHAERLALAS